MAPLSTLFVALLAAAPTVLGAPATAVEPVEKRATHYISFFTGNDCDRSAYMMTIKPGQVITVATDWRSVYPVIKKPCRRKLFPSNTLNPMNATALGRMALLTGVTAQQSCIAKITSAKRGGLRIRITWRPADLARARCLERFRGRLSSWIVSSVYPLRSFQVLQE
jgi:hypothetical protein